MGFDRARVVEVYSRDAAGTQRVGSGYLVGDQVVLTAEHVVGGLPVQGAGASGLGKCEVRPLGVPDWLPAQVVWQDSTRDVALLRLADDWGAPTGSPVPGWGRLEGAEQVGCMAVGFPWAQARPDQVRDTEQLFGQIAPLTTSKAGRLAVNVVTAPPTAPPEDGSPWAGMSGAALFAGPYLVGVVVVDPARYGTDRLQATPISVLTEDPDWWQTVGGAGELVGVGPRFRLAVTQDLSLALQPPYRPLPAGLDFATAPVRLLLPEHGIVPFLGRHQLLDDLHAWCTPAPSSLGIQLLTGSGGAGKTRLAAELCVRLRGAGWDAGFADSSSPDGQTQLGFERAALLVVDDADLQVQLLAGILTRLASQPNRPALRLLLLARYQGAWWEQLTTQTDGLADDYAAPQLSLETGALALGERQQHRDTAAAVFAAQLVDKQQTVELPDLTNPAFANPLLIHMSVLLALLGEPAVNTDDASSRSRMLQRLLGRERRRWPPSLRGAGLADLGETVATQSVTVATLASPQTRAETVGLLQAVPDLADAPLERRGRIADWLHQLYPGEPGYVAPLRPDLLAEQQLADTPELAKLTVNIQQHAPSAAQVGQLLAELTRAAHAHPGVHAALNQLLDARLPELLGQALSAPTSPIPELLSHALKIAPHREAASQLVDRLPARGTALAALAVTITGQAVQHYRQLAEDNPDAHLHDLARILDYYGTRLSDMGRRQESLEAAVEATKAYSRLVETDPGTDGRELLGAFNNLAASLADAGRREEALEASKLQETWSRQYVKVDPDTYRPILAMALQNLAIRLAEMDRHQDALAPAEEAVDLFRALAEEKAGTFLADLAGALIILSNRLANVDRSQEAIEPAEEALQRFAALAEANPDAYLPDVAWSLFILAMRLYEVGRHQEALARSEEAVQRYRAFPEASRDAHRSDFAIALRTLTECLVVAGRGQDALGPATEAVESYRALAGPTPSIFLPDLAIALDRLANLLTEAGRYEDADRVRNERADVLARMGYERDDGPL